MTAAFRESRGIARGSVRIVGNSLRAPRPPFSTVPSISAMELEGTDGATWPSPARSCGSRSPSPTPSQGRMPCPSPAAMCVQPWMSSARSTARSGTGAGRRTAMSRCDSTHTVRARVPLTSARIPHQSLRERRRPGTASTPGLRRTSRGRRRPRPPVRTGAGPRSRPPRRLPRRRGRSEPGGLPCGPRDRGAAARAVAGAGFRRGRPGGLRSGGGVARRPGRGGALDLRRPRGGAGRLAPRGMGPAPRRDHAARRRRRRRCRGDGRRPVHVVRVRSRHRPAQAPAPGPGAARPRAGDRLRLRLSHGPAV